MSADTDTAAAAITVSPLASATALFWTTFDASAQQPREGPPPVLPPWIASMLPALTDAGVAAVADVIASGTRFRAAIHTVADRKRALKREREAVYRDRVAALEAQVEEAAEDVASKRHAFVASLHALRAEVESYRADVAKLETSLSNNNKEGSEATDNAAAAAAPAVDPDRKLIDDQRGIFDSKCDSVRERWSLLLRPESSSTSKAGSAVRPPWQLMYCANNDPFAPPQSDAAKVAFDGGKILDRFGRDIWEDRCVGVGVTVQCGAEGAGVRRFRSLTHSRVTRSAPWHRWAGAAAAAGILAAPTSATGEVQFNVCDSSAACSCTIADPFAADFFAECDGQRVMTFMDILGTLSSKRSAADADAPRLGKMSRAVLACFERFKHFPLLGYAPSAPSAKQRFDLSHLATYRDVDFQAAAFLGQLVGIVEESNASGSGAVVAGGGDVGGARRRLRCVAACVADRPEWFIMDVACAAAGVLFVGMHTSWPAEDVARAIAIVQPDVVIFHERNAAQSSAVKEAAAAAGGSGAQEQQQQPLLIPFETFEAGAFASGAAMRRPRLCDVVGSHSLLRDAMENPAFLCADVDGDAGQSDVDEDFVRGRPFTLMFSSGTSGKLKAVEVSARAWLDTNLSQQKYDLDPFSVVSFNAMAHGLDRGMCWTALFNAGRISFVQQEAPGSSSNNDAKARLIAELAQAVGGSDCAAAESERLAPFVPDFVVASRVADPSVLVAAPDAWTSLKHVLDAVGLTALVERTPIPTLRQEVHADAESLSKLRAAILLLFGRSVRQVGTGGAPVSAGVLAFYRKLFAFVPHAEEQPLRALIHAKRARGDPTAAEDEAEPLGAMFVDVYGATEAPGIATDSRVRGSLEVALLPVPGYALEGGGYGELAVRGQGVARAYHNAAPSDNEAAFLPGGWYRTGDVVQVTVARDDAPPTSTADNAATDGVAASTATTIVEGEHYTRVEGEFAGLLQDCGGATAAALLIKKAAMHKLRMHVVDRVKDLVELYVDHQSAWVPSTLVEDAVLQHSRRQDRAAQGHVEIVQAAVFGDRMLPFLVAVVGIADSAELSSSASFQSAAQVEAAVVQQFRDALRPLQQPDYWVPKVVLLHRVASSHNTSRSTSSNSNSIVPATMEEWAHGGEYRTHLGKLRRGVLAKAMREQLAAAFVKGQQ